MSFEELDQAKIDLLGDEELSVRKGVNDEEFEEEQNRLLEEIVSQTRGEFKNLLVIISIISTDFKKVILLKTGIDIDNLSSFLNQKVSLILENIYFLKKEKQVVFNRFNSFVELKNIFIGLTGILNNFNGKLSKNKNLSYNLIKIFKDYFDYGFFII